MKTLTALVCVVAFCFSAAGKEHPVVKIQILDSHASTREYTYTTPGTAAKSNTSCDTSGNGTYNGTTYGNTTYGNTNGNAQTDCTTTTTPGRPAQTHTRQIQQEHIRAVLPNGNAVTLWCQAGFRKCYELQPGTYEAEITGGSTLLVHVTDLQGKVQKIKYRTVASN